MAAMKAPPCNVGSVAWRESRNTQAVGGHLPYLAVDAALLRLDSVPALATKSATGRRINVRYCEICSHKTHKTIFPLVLSMSHPY
jgi:hypothetical protein